MSKDSYPFGHGIPGREFGLETVLRQWPVKPAREAFRAGLKQRFLTGGAQEEAAEGEPVNATLVAVLQTCQAPSPTAEFTDRARAQFLADLAADPDVDRDPATTGAVPAPFGPPKERTRAVRSAGSQAKRPGKLLSFWAPLAVAAALLFVFFRSQFGDQPAPVPGPNALAWSLPDALEELVWAIDGETVASTETLERIEQRLRTAKRVAAVGGGLRLAYGRLFQVEVAEGSELDLSRFRESDSETEFHLGMLGDSGGFYFQTGPDFKRNRCELTFQTPEAEIAVVGTVFAVDRYTGEGNLEGTCVCCSEGTVSVKGAQDRQCSTAAGHSCFIVPGDKSLLEGKVMQDHLKPMRLLTAADAPKLWLE